MWEKIGMRAGCDERMIKCEWPYASSHEERTLASLRKCSAILITND